MGYWIFDYKLEVIELSNQNEDAKYIVDYFGWDVKNKITAVERKKIKI